MVPKVAERLERLLEAARQIADASHPLGREARQRLASESDLSPEGIELALARSLEHAPSESELQTLMARAVPAPRAHVVLSASVFTAAHRAIATALAASASVAVRPSRRDPVLAQLLHRAAPELFTLVTTIGAQSGDHVFAYGGDYALAEIRRSLPAGSVFHPHGPGFGVIVCDATNAFDAALAALDVAVFDQRGCLSPRVVVVEGSHGDAVALAGGLARSLAEIEAHVPLGRLSAEESAEVVRYRDAQAYSGSLFPAGRGFVGIGAPAERLRLAPVGRNLHVLASSDAAAMLAAHASTITTYALASSPALAERLRTALPRAREAALGSMQTPAFDGPVDLRHDPAGESV